jgi:malate dehydrogenase
MGAHVRTKITVVGAGNVGATLAQRLAERNYADVVLVDIIEGLPQGKALDILEAGPIAGYDSLVSGSNGYEETASSELVCITSGVARKPGMSRDDLVMTNARVVASVVGEVARHSPEAILLCITNPLDAMTQLAQAVSGFPRERVIGMAGVLDTARFRTFIAQELGASVDDVQAYVLGGHGDTMVPLTRFSTVAGIPVASLIPPPRLAEIVQRARDGGAEIVALLKTGSAYYAPSAAAAQMVDAIVLDKRAVLPCAVKLQGEFGIHGLYTGVPARLGAGGLIEVLEVDLQADELEALHRSARAVQEVVAVIDANRSAIGAGVPELGAGAWVG